MQHWTLPSLVHLSSGDLLNHADPRSERGLTRENEIAYFLPNIWLLSQWRAEPQPFVYVYGAGGTTKKKKEKKEKTLSGISGITDAKTNQSIVGW